MPQKHKYAVIYIIAMEFTERICIMEIRVLRYFLTVVREDSITKAADVLNITQPTPFPTVIANGGGSGRKII